MSSTNKSFGGSRCTIELCKGENGRGISVYFFQDSGVKKRVGKVLLVS